MSSPDQVVLNIDHPPWPGGALLARTNWTPRAKAQVENREYRFLSPVFDYAKDTLRIVRMVSVGLTNTPNLRLQALKLSWSDKQKRSPRYYQFKVEVSPDGAAWTCVGDLSANTAPATKEGVTFSFQAVAARYVRVTMLKNSANPGMHISELSVFGGGAP